MIDGRGGEKPGGNALRRPVCARGAVPRRRCLCAWIRPTHEPSAFDHRVSETARAALARGA